MKYDFNTFIEQYTAFIESGQREEASALLQDYKSFLTQLTEYTLDVLINHIDEQQWDLDSVIGAQWELLKQYKKYENPYKK